MSMGFVKSAYIKENFGGNKMFKKLKDKKGFTLVELIVVLVILAILAALLIPALTGYIDKANKDKVTAECRQVVVAAQTCVSEAYGQGKITTDSTDTTATKITSPTIEEIKKLAEAGSNWTAKVYVLKDASGNVAKGTVAKVEFSDGTNSCIYKYDSTTKSFVYEIDSTAKTTIADEGVVYGSLS